MDPPTVFAVERAAFAGAPGVRVAGELDLAVAQALTEALDAAIRDSHGAFVVDLTDVTFLDSTCLSVFMRARALLGREERELAIVCPPGATRRVLELASADELFVLLGAREQVATTLRLSERSRTSRQG